MLRWRLILGAVFVAALVGLFVLDARTAAEGTLPAGLFLLAAALTATTGATHEFLTLVRRREPLVDGRSLYVGNWLTVAAPWLVACTGSVRASTVMPWLVYVGAAAATVLVEMVRYDREASQRVTERIATALLGLTYIGLLMSFLVRLRLSTHGLLPLVSLLVIVKMCDVGAYTVGRLIGRRKLAPRLSPGKTLEGLAGGLVFAVVAGWVCLRPLAATLGGTGTWSVGTIVLYSLAVGAAGVVGDLFESLLKRDFGVKDSSTWMPGFGGVLDLLDSPLAAAPVAWAFWQFPLTG